MSTRTKLTKIQTGKQNYSKVPVREQSNENKTNKYVERKGQKQRIDMQSQMEVDEEDLYIHYRLTARGKEQ